MSNIYNYEKVVVLELVAKGDAWNIEVLEVCQGVPTKSIVSSNTIDMAFYNSQEEIVYSISVDDPKHRQLHTEHHTIPVHPNQTSSITVVVPYDHDCEKVICNQEELWSKSFELKKAIAKANQSFGK